MTVRKWYFASNQNALRNAFDLIQVAVISAKNHTDLKPVCLVEDIDFDRDLCPRLSWLRNSGVEVIRHNAEIFKDVEAIFGAERAKPFNGHWLRTDIPVIEYEDYFVLYTDIDVMFRSPLRFDSIPDFISCAPEHERDNWGYFNSGVMVMNLPALRATREELFETVRRNLFCCEGPYDDQTILNICYRNRFSRLPLDMNWKPYWGFSESAKIVHFHGPKPSVVRYMLAGNRLDAMPIYHEMHDRNPQGYAAYMREFYACLSGEDAVG